MVTQAELVTLGRIYNGTCYAKGVGPANHAIIQAAAEKYGHRPEVIAGLLMRESRGGEALDENGRGDGGHAVGLMQIDERWFPAFAGCPGWRDPAKNVDFGSYVLHLKRTALIARTTLHGADLERGSIAAYNCGEGNVIKAINAGEDLDARTTGKDFSRKVLEYAEAYRQLCVKPEAPAEPAIEPLPVPKPSLLAILADLIRRFFQARA